MQPRQLVVVSAYSHNPFPIGSRVTIREASPSFYVFLGRQLNYRAASAFLIVTLILLALVFITACRQKRRLVLLPFKPIDVVVLPTMVLSETRGHTAISGRARGHRVGQGPRPLGTWDDF